MSAQVKLARSGKIYEALFERLQAHARGLTIKFVIDRCDQVPSGWAVWAVPSRFIYQDEAMELGESIHALSTVLDHIAYELSEIHGGKPERARMPFRPTKEAVEADLDRGLLGSLPANVKRILLDEMRPYQTGDPNLWAIRQLDNIDKHRLIISHLAAATLTNVNLGIDGRLRFTGITMNVSAGDKTVVAAVRPGARLFGNPVSPVQGIQHVIREPTVMAGEVPTMDFLNASWAKAEKMIRRLAEAVYGTPKPDWFIVSFK